MRTHYGTSEIGVFERLPLRLLRHSRKMVRESLGNIDDLADSIREHGLMEPIVVRPMGELFEVVGGNRRLEACKRLHLKTVACHVVSLDDAESYEMALVENIQRQNMNPVEEAVAFRNYVDELGYGGVSQLAKKIGKSESFVSRRISLLDLPEEITRSMAEGRLSLMLAQELIPLPRAEAASLAKVAEESGLTREEVRAIARASAEGKKVRARQEASERVTTVGFGRAIDKATTTLKICLMRIDGAMEGLEEEDWMLKEALMECRSEIHLMTDRLIRLKVRSKKARTRSTLASLASPKGLEQIKR